MIGNETIWNSAMQSPLMALSKFKHVALALVFLLMAPIVSSQDISPTIKAIDASVEDAKAVLAFSAEFRLRSGWANSLSETTDEEFFSQQTDPELDRAKGKIYVRPGAFRYKFDIESPFHIIGGGTNFGSCECVFGNGVWLMYTPEKLSVEGVRAGENLSVNLGNYHSSGETIQGLFYSPYNASGFFDGNLFERYVKLNKFVFSESRRRNDFFNRDVLCVRAEIKQPQPYAIEWYFDDVDGRPVLIGVNDGERVTTFEKFTDLKCGIKFPLVATTVSGPLIVNGEKRYSVKKFEFQLFTETEPPNSDFEIQFSNPRCVMGYNSSELQKKLNVFEIDHKLISQGSDRPFSSINQIDDGFIQKAASKPTTSWVLVVFCMLVAAGAAIAFLKKIRTRYE